MVQPVVSKPHALSFAAFFLLAVILTAVVVGYFTWYKWVTVFVDGHPHEIVTTASTVDDVLFGMDIQLLSQDYVFPSVGQPLSRGMGIVVIKAQPYIVSHDGKTTEVWSVGNKVSDILMDAGISYYSHDVVVPPAETTADATQPISVIRVESEIVEEKVIIPFATRHIPNYNMYRGQQRVHHPGRDGVVINTIEVIYHDGQETERNVVDSRELVSKRDREIEIGTIGSLNRRGYSIQIKKVLDVVATGYCPGTPGSGCPINEQGHSRCTGPYNNGRTADGSPAKEGSGTLEDPYIIAVDPKVIPMGSLLWLEFPGGRVTTRHGTIIRDGFAVAADVGGAIKENRIDVLFDLHSVAWSFGRRSVRVFVIESVEPQ